MTTIDHPEIPMDRNKAWRTGASLFLVAFGIFSFSALLHFHVVHEGRSGADSALLVPVLGLSAALGFAGALSFSLLLTLWASIAFVTDQWAEPLRRIWISLVFALCLAVFVHGLDYDGGSLGGPIATRMAYVLGDTFSTFFLGLLTMLAFLLATNWLFFDNFLTLARGRSSGDESGLVEFEERLLQAKDDAERDEILSSFDAGNFARPVSPSAQLQEGTGEGGALATSTAAGGLDSQVETARREQSVEEASSGALSAEADRGSLRIRPRVGRATPVPTSTSSPSQSHSHLQAGSGQLDEELKSTDVRRDRIRSARLRRDQEVLEEILEEVRSSIGPEEDAVGVREGGDPMADLDDDLLLEKAGQALDELLGEGGGSIELNLPDRSSEESQERNPCDSDLADQVQDDPPTSTEKSEGGRGPSEPRIQTAMGRIPIVDRGTDAVEGPAQEELFPAVPPEVTPAVTPKGEAQDPAPEPEVVAPEAVEPEAMDPEAVEPETGETEAVEEQTGAQEAVQQEVTEQEVTEQEPVESAELEAEEPVFILEPMPPARVYRDLAQEETPEYTQEGLFAEEAPAPELLNRAATVLLTSRRPTASLLQRRIGLSYAEARQVMFYMQQLGVLAAPVGSGPWEALISLGEWEERRA